MNAEAERQVLARPRAVDDESYGFSITSSSRLPETYHMTTLSPLLICWPRSSASAVAVRRMWATGVCQRMISGHDARPPVPDSPAACELVRILVQRYSPPVIELRVVSLPPTISRSEVAQELGARHVARRLAVRQHRHQVGFGGCLHALVPKGAEVPPHSSSSMTCFASMRRPVPAPVTAVAMSDQ